ncbi:UPF0426 protein At1g28150, chloroplastic isoform X1 [Typha angustifolia]|uniref:UPF0426 protein At1g28150, chloroplastic isoform X1 n=1 Tax=Typha angustifolia TaxID=59011 RepID=UPI003C2DF39E
MALLLTSATPITAKRSLLFQWVKRNVDGFIGRRRRTRSRVGTPAGRIQAFFNPFEDQPPIVKDALKEPVAFMGGVFAGLLRLDLNEDPLKEWVSRTMEASGIAKEGQISDGESEQEGEGDAPQQIEIE